MKFTILAAPLALLLATTAFGQTATETPAADPPEGSGMMYGAEWPEAVGSTFMSKTGDTMSMRTKEEIAVSWVALTQADRDAVMADCKTFEAEVRGGAGSAKGDGSAPAGTDATGAVDDLAMTAGISGADMALVCESVSTL